MYYIVFFENFCIGNKNYSGDVYSGGSYIYQGEKYACINGIKPKLYKSEKIARNSAEKLIKSCVNIGSRYEIHKHAEC